MLTKGNCDTTLRKIVRVMYTILYYVFCGLTRLKFLSTCIQICSHDANLTITTNPQSRKIDTFSIEILCL